VGICAYNEEKNIGSLLNNVLFEQALPVDSEVLVVCSGCTDNTASIVQEFAEKDSRLKVHVEEKRNGKASAINYILSHATGDVIIFISADTLPKKGSFSRLTAKVQKPNVGIVCGNPLPVNPPTSLIGRIVKLLWSFHGHVFEQLNDSGLARHATELFCIRKGIIDRIPAETVNDDAYLAVETKKKGWFIKFDAQSQVLISGPSTFQEYFQQRRRIIFGHFQIKKLTGESSQYLVHLLPLHPLQTLKLSLWLFAKYDPVTLFAFLFMEFLVNVFAIGDVVARRDYFRWRALPSTKTVVSGQELIPEVINVIQENEMVYT
jgi:poly-beta-1,6-N-acetyl-D-glucosamine synthase